MRLSCFVGTLTITNFIVACIGAACRLYFDLEFKIEFNPGKDGSKMVEIFIQVVINQLL